MKRHFKTLAMVMTCMAMALCVSCKKDDDNEPGGGAINGHEYVDLGLPSGTLWATCNVGADKPEDYGSYFAWGETETKNEYNWNTYKWCNGGSYNTLTKYNTGSGFGTVDDKTILDPDDDAAHVNWGGGWRTPTREEMEELKGNCTWEWTTQGGKKGYRVTGTNGNSIFLPAAGFRANALLISTGSRGEYWSSSLLIGYPSTVCFLCFDFDKAYVGGNQRYYGNSVRPVCRPQ